MFGLDPDTISNIKEAFSKDPEIEKVLLYGSRAKGDHKNGSDIDITLLGKNLSLKTIYKLNEEIYQLYLPYTFDISIFTQINNDDLVEHILSVGKTFYTRNNSQLPKGWEVKRLGDIVTKLGSGATPKGGQASYKEFGISLIRSMNVYDYGFVEKNLAFIDEEQAKKLNNVNVEEGDLLLNITGASVARCCIVPKEYLPARVNQHVSIIRLRKKIVHEEFLHYSLISKDNKKKLLGIGEQGSTRQAITKSQIENFIVRFPSSIEEQKRIVAILDKTFAAIAKAKANAEQNLKNAKDLFESYLQGVFENKGEGWEEKTIGKVCSEIFAGGDAPKDNFSKEKNGKYEIPIFANAVKDRGLYGFTDFSRVTEPSITIAARGSGTGHTEIRYEQFLPIVRLIVLIPNLSLVTLEFLKHSIDNLEILRSGSAIPQLTVPMIKEYRIPFPPINKQQTIVKKLDTLSEETKKLKSIYQQKIEDLEELKKSILQKAFHGELTMDNGELTVNN